MSEKRRRIVQLLETLNDHLRSPATALRTSSGLAGTERVACPACTDGSEPGWVTDRFKRRYPCVFCGGKQEPRAGNWRKADGGRGWVNVDPMDADRRPVQTVTEAAPPTRPPRMVGCDACGGSGTGRPHLDVDTGREWRDPCSRCNGGGKVQKPELRSADPDTTANDLTDTERRDRSGSYHELDDALARLPQQCRRVIWLAYVTGYVPADTLDVDDTLLLELGMTLLETWMPDPVRVPRDVREAEKRRREHRERLKGLGRSREAVVARDREIRRLIRRGRPTQWVAGEYGLSVSQVNRIVQGEEQAA